MRMAISLMDGMALMVIGVSSVIPRQIVFDIQIDTYIINIIIIMYQCYEIKYRLGTVNSKSFVSKVLL